MTTLKKATMDELLEEVVRRTNYDENGYDWDGRWVWDGRWELKDVLFRLQQM